MRRERERRGWTQAELAAKLAEVGVNLHPSAIAKIELREVVRPRTIRLDEAQAIAYVLGLPLEEMSRTSIDRFDDLMVYIGQTLIRMRDDATTVYALVGEAEAQLASMDSEASAILTEEHSLSQLAALVHALPLDQLTAYVSVLLDPSHPFHGVIGASVRESNSHGQHPNAL